MLEKDSTIEPREFYVKHENGVASVLMLSGMRKDGKIDARVLTWMEQKQCFAPNDVIMQHSDFKKYKKFFLERTETFTVKMSNGDKVSYQLNYVGSRNGKVVASAQKVAVNNTPVKKQEIHLVSLKFLQEAEF